MNAQRPNITDTHPTLSATRLYDLAVARREIYRFSLAPFCSPAIREGYRILISDIDACIAHRLQSGDYQQAAIVRATVMFIREDLKDPKHWCKGVIARDAAGDETDATRDDAVCFCVLGAALHNIHQMGLKDTLAYSDVTGRLDRAATHAGNGEIGIAEYQDRHDHAAIISLLTRVILDT